MAITRVQKRFFQGSGSAPTFAFLSSVTAGSLLTIEISSYIDTGGTRSFTVADNNGNTWYEIYDANYNSPDTAGMAYCYNANSGATTITVTFTASAWYSVEIREISGIETTSSPLISNNTSGGVTSSSWNSGNVSPGVGAYLVGFMMQDVGSYTLTENGVWTLLDEEENIANMPGSWCERIVTAGTYNFTGTISSSVVHWAGIAAFKESGGAPATSLLSTRKIRTINQLIVR